MSSTASLGFFDEREMLQWQRRNLGMHAHVIAAKYLQDLITGEIGIMEPRTTMMISAQEPELSAVAMLRDPSVPQPRTVPKSLYAQRKAKRKQVKQSQKRNRK